MLRKLCFIIPAAFFDLAHSSREFGYIEEKSPTCVFNESVLLNGYGGNYFECCQVDSQCLSGCCLEDPTRGKECMSSYHCRIQKKEEEKSWLGEFVESKNFYSLATCAIFILGPAICMWCYYQYL